MSDKKPESSTPDAPAVAKVEPGVSKDKVKDGKPPKAKGYSNPALRMMGLPALRLPSRNWMIFWTVLAIGSGGIVYDRYQQRQIRKKWMDRVAKFGEKKLGPNELARKVRVYVAPPPSDYLDESMAVFRHYVKPILNSGGVDYQIQSEDRQGVIRSVVAADIRALRREILENEARLQQLKNDTIWYNKIKNWLRGKSSSDLRAEKEAVLEKKFTDDLNLADVLGVYYKNIRKGDQIKSEDAELVDPSLQGGVICIGRGAFKEYLHGLHEGLLGPLEKPLEHTELEEAEKAAKSGDEALATPTVEPIEPPKVLSLNEIETENNNGVAGTTDTEAGSKATTSNDLNAITDEHEEETVSNNELSPLETEQQETKTKESEDEEKEDKKLPIPKPFISPEDYPKAKFAPELNFNSKISTPEGTSPFFQQPLLVIPVHHLLGFLNTPQRIYRLYTKRRLTEEYGKVTVALVENLYSPFSLNDVDLAKAEEEDWPKKWVEAGLEKKSEWTSPLVTDERVLSKLKVYDPDRVVTVEKD